MEKAWHPHPHERRDHDGPMANCQAGKTPVPFPLPLPPLPPSLERSPSEPHHRVAPSLIRSECRPAFQAFSSWPRGEPWPLE